MTIFYLISSNRGEDNSAELMSAHKSLEGAKKALVKWVEDYEYSMDYLGEKGMNWISEDRAIFIESCKLQD